jgi:Beta-propeller repeat/Abnormal spindle-like microcephaly-assoc'd, ASPM-SPD-2-Hydin
MKAILVLGMFVSVSLTVVGQVNLAAPRTVKDYGNLPMAFEANQGQTDAQVMYLSRGLGYTLFLTSTEAVLSLREGSRQDLALSSANPEPLPRRTLRGLESAVLRMKLRGANSNADVSAHDELLGKSNYFTGSDPRNWRTDVGLFSKIRYANVYPGVDLIYYGHQGELEYDFVLQPGASPQKIRLEIAGAKRLRLEHGDLVLTLPSGDVRLGSPHIYQEANGNRHQVRGGYVISAKGEVGFEVAAYDHRRDLVIDPVLAYATYLAGSSTDHLHSIAVDSVGNAYVVGDTGSIDFPTAGAIQPTITGDLDAFVTKFNRDGTALIYSTFLGGSLLDTIYGVAVDSSGEVYVAGWTFSPDFPTKNAFQSTSGGNADTFVAKINAAGSALAYSTYLGGTSTDFGRAIAVDSVGNAYVAGFTDSSDFPTKNAFQPANAGSYDAFVSKLSPDGSTLVYSTYLGGTGEEQCTGIALDSVGNAYIAGATQSTDFPTKNAIQPIFGGGLNDAFVAKFGGAGNALIYSTYLGGGETDYGSAIAVDFAGNAYVVGLTNSANFPISNALQPTLAREDAFVTKLNPSGSAPVYSTYLGGTGSDAGKGVAVDSAGDAYVTGVTSSSDFPMLNPIQSTIQGRGDAFVTEINPQGTALVYSTYLGGQGNASGASIAVDSARSAYITGSTKSQFAVTPVAFQQTLATLNHGFVAKIAQKTSVGISSANLYFDWDVIGITSPAKIVTVTNKGSGTLTIKKIYIGGVDSGDFAETNTCSSTLPAGTSCRVSITFTPSAKDGRRAGLAISTPDPASPDAVGLHGIGTFISLSTTKLTFGNVGAGTSSPPQSVTLTNNGSTLLNFTGITIIGTNAEDFSETTTCGTSLAAKASCTLTVTFKPTATGTRTGYLTISHDAGGSPRRVYLKGTGT